MQFLGKSINLFKANQATDGKVGTSYHSTHAAQPLRSTIQTEDMSSKLQDETIPMAYSGFFNNKNEEQDTTNYSLSSKFRLGNEIYDENKSYPMEKTIEQSFKEIKHFIKEESPTIMPLEVHSTENMSSNLRGETIPMACSCFSEKQRNFQQEDLDYSTQEISLKQLFRSGKTRRSRKKDEVNNWYQINVVKQENRNTQLIKNYFRDESVLTSNQARIISNLSYSNHLAQPFEVVLSVIMSSNLQGETVPMAWSCFFRKT
jgi:hypothetical protein